MAIDYAKSALPKGRPAKLQKADRVKARQSYDETESAKVKARSGGQCEVVTAPHGVRCKRRGLHVHHLLGGFGVRGRGASAKVENKLHVCVRCHADIHAHVLVRDGAWWRQLT
jgi:hypothetical protein